MTTITSFFRLPIEMQAHSLSYSSGKTLHALATDSEDCLQKYLFREVISVSPILIKKLAIYLIKSIARTITDPYIQSQALLEIVKAKLRITPKTKSKTFLEAIKLLENDPYNKVLAYLKIANEMIEIDLNHAIDLIKKAHEIALSIDNPSDKNKVLLEVVKVQAKVDLINAKNTTNDIHDTIILIQALLEIYKQETVFNPGNAEITMGDIQSKIATLNPFAQILSLLEIAKVEIELHPDIPSKSLILAKGKAGLLQELQTEAFLEIVSVEAKANPVQALETADEIQISKIKDQALLEIVKASAKDNPNLARTAAGKIVDPSFQIQALLERAKFKNVKDANRLLSRAEKKAHAFPNILIREKHLLKIVEARATVNRRKARQTADKIFKFSQYRVRAFFEIDKARSQAGPVKKKAFFEAVQRKVKTNPILPRRIINCKVIEYSRITARDLFEAATAVRKDATQTKDSFHNQALFEAVVLNCKLYS